MQQTLPQYIAASLIKGTRRKFSSLHSDYLKEQNMSDSNSTMSNLVFPPQAEPAPTVGPNLIQAETKHQPIANTVAKPVDGVDLSDTDRQ